MHPFLRKSNLLFPGLCALAVVVMTPSIAPAAEKPKPGVNARGFRLFARSLGAITINRIYCGLATTGEVCVDSTNSSTIGGGFWPKGTADQYVFNSGLQVAGVVGADGGPWAGDTTGAFFFDPKGTTQHGEQVEPKLRSGPDPVVELDDVLRDALSDLLQEEAQYGPVVDHRGHVTGVLSIEILGHALRTDPEAVPSGADAAT
jgi:hypothetical protein